MSHTADHSWNARCEHMCSVCERPDELDMFLGVSSNIYEIIEMEVASNEGKPCQSLRQHYGSKTNEELREDLRSVGYASTIPKGPKARLVDLLMSLVPQDPMELLNLVAPFGAERVRGFKRLLDSGGETRVPKDYLSSRDQLVTPVFPVVFLYDYWREFVNIIPEEFRTSLASLPDEAWDEMIERGDQYDEACDFLWSLCDLRGAVKWEETFELYRTQVAEPLTLLKDAVSPSGIPWTYDVGFFCEELCGEPYLVDARLKRLAQGMWSQPRQTMERYVQAAREHTPRDVFAELRDAKSVLEWVMNMNVVSSLLACLDEHAPLHVVRNYDESIEDYAGDMLTEMVEDAQASVYGEPLADLLADDGFSFTAEEREHINELADTIITLVPRWDLNGWSDMDVYGEPRPYLEEDPEESLGNVPVPGGKYKQESALEREQRFQKEVDAGIRWPVDECGEVNREAAYAEIENLLDEIADWLRSAGLSLKTASKHANNTWHYLRYITNYEGLAPRGGVEWEYVNDYPGSHFIRKMMWSTPRTIRETATGLKKFYRFMLDTGKISKDDLEVFLAAVKEGLPLWCEKCAQYNDPKSPSPFTMWDWM